MSENAGLGDPSTWRHIRPTICDEIVQVRPVTPAISGAGPFTLGWDHWRQIEFVVPDIAAIEVMLEGVREVRRASAGTMGYSEVYLRKGLNAPLSGVSIRLRGLRSGLGKEVVEHDGIEYPEMRGLVRGGFAFRSKHLCVYGCSKRGRVGILGVHPTETDGRLADTASRLADFAAQHRLVLIHWCSATTASTREGILDILTTLGGDAV